MEKLGGGVGATFRYGVGAAGDFLGDRRATVLARLRMAVLLAACCVGLGLVLSPLLEPDWSARGVVGMLVQGLICAVVYWCSGRAWAKDWSNALAAGFILGMAAFMPPAVLALPGKFQTFVSALIVFAVAAALFFPWGARPQAGLVVALLGWMLLVYPLPSLPMFRVGEALFLYGIAGFLSIFGALLIDRYRLSAFVEREQARLLARDRELLLDVGRELIAAPNISSLVERVVCLARPLLACDRVDLQLYEAERGVLRVEAVAGGSEDGAGRMGLEFAPSPEFVAALDEGRVISLPGDARIRELELVLKVGGARHMLVAPMLHEGGLLGLLNFTRESGPPFTDEQRELVHGIANETGIALSNARLVEDLQRANRVKSEFVSMMSHELRTPLHVILGYTEMLDDSVASTEEVVGKVRFAASELLDLVEATLDLDRLESGRDEPEFRRIRIGDLLQELEDELGAIPRTGTVDLSWHVEAGDSMLSTDRRKLKIILTNLIMNALKFTAEGSVQVSSRRIADRYEVSVRDTGDGIAPADLSRVFDMFEQVPAETELPREGVGLGLYIARRLSEQLGATIDVESVVGQGSLFRLRVPCS